MKKRPPTKISVELYRTNACPFCQEASTYLKARAIAFKEYNIERDKHARKQFESFGTKKVPVLRIHGKKMIGWDMERFEALYNA